MAKADSIHTSYWVNVVGTETRSCKCGTWSNHWNNYSGSYVRPVYCSVSGCYNAAEVGAHMRPYDSYAEYIVLTCRACNNRTDIMTLKPNTYIASANKSKTCDK